MAHVKYDGLMDRRELSAADWKVLGVEDASKTVFEKGEPYEVSDQVLGVLVELGDFKEISDAQVEKLLGNSDEDDGEPDSSSAQQGLDASTTGNTTTTTSRARTGRGNRSSTSGT